jgi:endonuclease-8
LYSATDVHWLRGEEHPYLQDLGPDVLTVGTDEIARRLGEGRWSRRALGTSLLDQAFFAGVGNYLRSEILFVAGLLPERRPADLSEEERDRLVEAIALVARRSYETGLTVEPRVAQAGRRSGLPRGAWRHHVFGRAGRPCPRCGQPVRYTEVGGRRLYLCGTCQR